jgi:hypothetical protein
MAKINILHDCAIRMIYLQRKAKSSSARSDYCNPRQLSRISDNEWVEKARGHIQQELGTGPVEIPDGYLLTFVFPPSVNILILSCTTLILFSSSRLILD